MQEMKLINGLMMIKESKIKNVNCPYDCNVCNKNCLFYKKAKKRGSTMPQIVSRGILIPLFLLFFFIIGASESLAAVSVIGEFPSDGNVGDLDPVYERTIGGPDEATDYIVAEVYLGGGVAFSTWFNYLTVNFGYGAEDFDMIAYDPTYNTRGWFIFDNRTKGRQGAAILKSDVKNGYPTMPINIDLFYIAGISELLEYDIEANSSNHLSHTINLTEQQYKYIFIQGQSQYASTTGGVEIHNYSGTHSYASSSPALNGTYAAHFSSASARADMAMVFETYHTIEYSWYSITSDPALTYQDPKQCQYGSNCDWDFFYTSILDEEATATINWIALENGQTIATTSFWLNIPFQTFTIEISSTTGFMIGDSDEYYINIEQGSSVLWSSTGTVQWTGTTTFWQDELFPSCEVSNICPQVSTTTSFFSAENMACGLQMALCYAFKPSSGSVNALLSGLSGMADNFPFNSVFGLLDDVSGWSDTTDFDPEMSEMTFQTDYGDITIMNSDSLIERSGVLTEDEWEDYFLFYINIFLNIFFGWFLFKQVLYRTTKHHQDFTEDSDSYEKAWRAKQYEARNLAEKINKR